MLQTPLLCPATMRCNGPVCVRLPRPDDGDDQEVDNGLLPLCAACWLPCRKKALAYVPWVALLSFLINFVGMIVW